MSEHEIIEAVAGQAGEFHNVSELVSSSPELQASLAALVAGLAAISAAYRSFSSMVRGRRFNYVRPHLSRFARVGILPFFAIVLVSSMNGYIQSFDVFAGDDAGPAESFSKILNTINILVIGYSVAQLIPIIITKHEKKGLERDDFEAWKDMRGFPDDDGDLFHKLFRWVPPARRPDEIPAAEYDAKLATEEGRRELERFRTSRGTPVGSHEEVVDDPFEEWKESERAKYSKYYEACVTGGNDAGIKLHPGRDPEEIHPIDTWREEKRMGGFDPMIPGARPPGYAAKKRKNIPRSIAQLIPLGIFAGVALGVVSWWGVDLFVLATATGGLAIGVGLALQETLQNYFAYIMIRKDKIFAEGERIKLDSGYNGYVHKITPRVTYVRDALNESFAIIPTKQLVTAQIINFSKEVPMVPAIVEVGVSYLNDPRQVSAVLVKVGKRAMREVVDDRGRHLVRQARCPYLDENRPGCGCDSDIHVDVTQPVVRFNSFSASSLDFAVWLYVRDYGAQFKTKTDMRVIMYEEFKKYDIRIPWPIRTVYQGDEAREAEEIGRLDAARREVIKEFGTGDIVRGGGED
ncbi:MAG: mechanosensitive ion channel [Nitrosopumilus sp.]|nr:mechanosensitive ion channel [Nitrosopumilus sp.]CAI9830850.1 Small-conductance mechanosensitive channel [Nitrosopumilaceae archaeon]MDA7941105.1 mechanosensitive ion channel [Nitrosopumilus sp.]MDA7944544.1 mechanosensitive ion channel [Nitrosopumilus sp.]MDA7954296.1 mechanosensitive ion channel [Nitrosopumilus sp.]